MTPNAFSLPFFFISISISIPSVFIPYLSLGLSSDHGFHLIDHDLRMHLFFPAISGLAVRDEFTLPCLLIPSLLVGWLWVTRI